jgi:hypothetical protein
MDEWLKMSFEAIPVKIHQSKLSEKNFLRTTAKSGLVVSNFVHSRPPILSVPNSAKLKYLTFG